MLLNVPTFEPSRNRLTLPRAAASFLAHAAPLRPGRLSPLVGFLEEEQTSAERNRAAEALRADGVLVQTRGGLTLRAPFDESVRILLAPAALLDVLEYRGPGQRPRRSIFFGDGSFLVEADVRDGALHVSPPRATASTLEKLSAKIDAGPASDWSGQIEAALLKTCALIAPHAQLSERETDWLAAVETAGLAQYGEPRELLEGLVGLGLLEREGAEQLRPSVAHAPMWRALSVPETIILSVGYADGVEVGESWLGAPGARCRVVGLRSPDERRFVELSTPGTAGLHARLRERLALDA